jgi:predicted esterase
VKEINIQFNYTARYYKLGELTPDTKQLWFVIHGYGQLAQYFIKKFKVLENDATCVIAPEGLSRFYLEDVSTRVAGGSNRVGATWMTRENRETDIENYVNFLQAIYHMEVPTSHNLKITILGFSQGSATATRWVLTGKPQFQRFILWAGIFPPDMNFEKGKTILKDKDIVTVFGNEDPFITPARLEEMNTLTAKLDLHPHKMEFIGKHEMNDEVLGKLSRL